MTEFSQAKAHPGRRRRLSRLSARLRRLWRNFNAYCKLSDMDQRLIDDLGITPMDLDIEQKRRRAIALVRLRRMRRLSAEVP